MASFNSKIPLHCSICPRRPKFSDVSHLLTHIASKGHLSHYYKVQIRSASEEDARQLIDTYNGWYTEWGIEHLMSDRMNLKDKRRTRARSANARRQAENAPPDALRRKAVSAANALDPRLAEQLVKNEPTPSPSPQFHTHPYPMPSLGPQQNVLPSPHPTTPSTLSNSGLIEDSDVFTEQPEIRSRMMIPSMPRVTVADKDSEGVIDATIVNEASKLKGVCWPGMDIFDSATPEMKRKRNQKKDVSVVEQLELNSLGVEATEHIWTPCGSLHKERPISGSVTDSSPVKLDVSPTREFLVRPPLLDLPTNIRSSSNQPRSRRRSPKKRNDNDLVLEDELDQQRALYQTGIEPERTTAASRKRKRAFEVLREDNSESFGRSTTMSMLTSEFNPRPSQMRSRSQPRLTPQQASQPLVQSQQQLGQLHTQPNQSFPQQDFFHGIDLQQVGQTMNPFQSAFDPLAYTFNYTPTASYFDNTTPYSAQPFHQFQPFQPQADLSGMLGVGLATNNSWLGPNTNGLLNTNSFDADGVDLKGQTDDDDNDDDDDDDRTVTAPTTPGN